MADLLGLLNRSNLHVMPKILAQHLAHFIDIEGTSWYHLDGDFRSMFQLPSRASLAWRVCLGMASLVRATHCDGHAEDTLGGFLQVNIETHSTDPAQQADVRNLWPSLEVKESRMPQVYQHETVTPLLHFFSQFSKAVVIVLYVFLLMLITVWLLRGLPKKAPQEASVKDGCPRSWLIFLCTTYGFILCAADQYVPSIPQMGVDLSGSQGWELLLVVPSMG